MKTKNLAAGLAAAAMISCSQQTTPGPTAAAAPNPNYTCLHITDIQNITALDDSTLLFQMNGHRTYINHLPYACPMLKWAMDTGAGIEYNADPNGEICSNVYQFHVRHYGGVCSFGAFEPYTPPSAPGTAPPPPPPPQ